MRNRRHRSQRGNAILEFALGWAILWSLFAGIYQFGYAFYTYNALMTAVSNAAQLGSKMNYDTGSPGTFTTAIQNMVVYGDESAGTTPLVPNLSTSNVNVNVTTDANSMPQDVTVSITGYTINAIFTTFSMNNKPRATAVYMGRVSCASC